MSTNLNSAGIKAKANRQRLLRQAEIQAAIDNYHKPEVVEPFLVPEGEFVRYCEQWLKDNIQCSQ